MRLSEVQLSRRLDLARSLAQDDKFLHAVQVYRKLIFDEPSFPAPYLELASLCISAGNPGAAIATLRDAPKAVAALPEIMARLGSLYIQCGKHEAAIATLKPLSGERLPLVHFGLGIAYSALDNTRQAEEQFRITLKLDPAFPRVHEALAELLIRRGIFTEAMTLLRRGIIGNPYSATAHHLLGVAYSRSDQFSRAYEEFLLAVDLDPGDYAYWVNVGDCLLKLNRPAEAEPYFKKACELEPGAIEPLIGLSTVSAAAGDLGRSAEYLDTADLLSPHDPRINERRWTLLRIPASHRFPSSSS